MFVSVDITFYSFSLIINVAKVSFGRALEFRCRRVISLANHKLTFDERICTITRHFLVFF